MGAASKKDPNKNAFFTLVKIPSERKKIFRDLVAAQIPLLVKGPTDSMNVIARAMTDDRWISCLYHPDSETIDSLPAALEEFIVNFGINKEEFYFQTLITTTPSGLLIATDANLYKLQRRKAVRLSLPEQLGAAANITSLNEKLCFEEARILDFSTGGLRISLPPRAQQKLPAIHIGDTISMTLHFGKRIPFAVEAIVRYSGEQNLQTICGLEFINKKTFLENKLISLQMDMQSEIFRRWNRHQYD